MNSDVSPLLSLPVLIRDLRGSVGGWGLRGWLSGALVLLLYRRLGEIGQRIERMAARFQAGTIWRREVARGAVVAGGGRRSVEGRIWPCGFGWLVKAASWHAAGYGSQLRHVLVQPEMVALLQAAPQAGRVLRPLCRMLAIETSLLRPRSETPAVAVEGDAVAPVATPKRVRPPRAKVDWGRIPIPRGVMAAVRRQRALKG